MLFPGACRQEKKIGDDLVIEHPGWLYSRVLCRNGLDAYRENLDRLEELTSVLVNDGNLGDLFREGVSRVVIGRGPGDCLGYYDPFWRVFLDYRILACSREPDPVLESRFWLGTLHEYGHVLAEEYLEHIACERRRHPKEALELAANQAAIHVVGLDAMEYLLDTANRNQWRFYRGFSAPGFVLEYFNLAIREYDKGDILVPGLSFSTLKTRRKIRKMVEDSLEGL